MSILPFYLPLNLLVFANANATPNIFETILVVFLILDETTGRERFRDASVY